MTAHLEDQRLMALGLGEPPTADEARHLADCPACAAAPAEDARLWASFRRLPQPAPPPGFARGALSRYRRTRPVRHRPREVALGAALGLAVVVLLAAWLRGVAPDALMTATLWLTRWDSPLPRGIGWSQVLAVVLPLMALAAGILLATVGVILRRLSAATAK